MATTEELLAAAEAEEESAVFTVDWDTREITVPSGITQLGVESDEDTTRLYFSCPATYGEFDIATFGIRVNYANCNSSGTQISADIYYVEDAESDGETITFSWLVGRNAYSIKGTTKFIVCCKLLNSSGEVTNEINTTLASLPVLEGLEPEINIDDETLDIIDQILAHLTAQTEKVDEAAKTAEASAELAETAATNATDAVEAANSAVELANTAADAVLDQVNSLWFEIDSEDGGLNVIAYDYDDAL